MKEKKNPSTTESMKHCKGTPYEVKGDVVVIHKDDGDVTIPLELGKSAYSMVFRYLKRKTNNSRREGYRSVEQFYYKVEDSVLKIFRKDNTLLTERPLEVPDPKYPRTLAMRAILQHYDEIENGKPEPVEPKEAKA